MYNNQYVPNINWHTRDGSGWLTAQSVHGVHGLHVLLSPLIHLDQSFPFVVFIHRAVRVEVLHSPEHGVHRRCRAAAHTFLMLQ